MDSLDDIFLKAREIGDPAVRAAYLDRACGGDPGLRARVETMLRDAEGAEEFFGKEGTVAVTPAGQIEQVGTVIGRYKLLQKIGEGGMGVVYMAEQREPVVRKVALKIIKLGMDTRQVIARFEAERQALALMDHSNIAKVLDGGATDSGRPYFVMELVQGLPITQFCDEANLPMPERLALFMEVCAAVQHAHQKGIIHRDIKPSNILVTMHGDKPVPKVIDFGVAKATQGRLTDKTVFTQFQQFIGTPAYMSPEQTSLSGLDVDTRSDIYALGVLLYEMLTSKTPFDPTELLKAGLDHMRQIIREQEPPKPSTRLSTLEGEDLTITAKHRHVDPPRLIHLVRGDLDWIVMKCLEKDRARRYKTANGLAMDLQHHLHSEPVVARPPSTLYRVQKAIQRNKIAFTSAAIILLVLIAATLLSSWQAMRATRAEREARRQTETAQSLQRSIDYDRNLYRELWLARGYERRGQTNEALALFTKLRPQLAASLPQHRVDCEEVAKAFVRMGGYEEARAAYESIRASLETEAPREPGDFQRLIEAAAGSKGWPAAAEMCRKHFDLLSSEPVVWRTKAITFLYTRDEKEYAKASSAAIALAPTARNLDDIVAILQTVGLGEHDFSIEETDILWRTLQHMEAQIEAGLPLNREIRARAAMGGALLRLGRYSEFLRQTQVATGLTRIERCCSTALGALCEQKLGHTQAAYEAYVSSGQYTYGTPMEYVEALNGYEGFLDETERCFIVLRRQILDSVPGALADSLARRSRWREAAPVAARSIEQDPTNYWHYHTLAPLLVATGDIDTYRKLCERITARFGDTRNPMAAEKLAKACLFQPDAQAALFVVSNLAQIAFATMSVSGGKQDRVIGYFTKGLAEYRQGHFAAAAKQLQNSINLYSTAAGNLPWLEAPIVLAMTQFQLQQTNQARQTLAEALKLGEKLSRRTKDGDLTYDWRARLREQALMKEARAMIEPK